MTTSTLADLDAQLSAYDAELQSLYALAYARQTPQTEREAIGRRIAEIREALPRILALRQDAARGLTIEGAWWE